MHSNTQTIHEVFIPQHLNAIFSDIHWTEFDDLGKISQEFFSPQIKSISQQRYYAQHPSIKLTKNDEIWKLSSQYAYVTQNLSQIHLRHQVLVKYLNTQNQQTSSMKTDNLIYSPQLKLAQTNAVITIFTNKSTIHAQNLEINLNEPKHLKLIAASGEYTPKT